MNIDTRFIEIYHKDVNDFFDLAVVSYEFILERLNAAQTSQSDFISAYVDIIENSKSNNPNHAVLNKFYSELYLLIEECGVITLSRTIKNQIARLLYDIELDPYLDHVCNCLTPIYYVIAAIDKAVKEIWLPNWDERTIGELNKCRSNYSLFLRGDRIIDRLNEEIIMQDLSIRNNFDNSFPYILFWDNRNSLEGNIIPTPKTYCLNISDKAMRELKNNKEIKIAIVPFSSRKVDGGDSHFVYKRGNGSQFYWEYPESKSEWANTRTSNILREAILKSPNIIVFPEYSIGPLQLDVIKSVLMENVQNTVGLFFVVAGTTWTTENSYDENETASHDNISYVLDRYGNEIGRCYKYSPFFDSNGDDTLVECLTNPGHVNTLIYLKSFGYIQVAICRDVINGEHPELIAKGVMPTMLVVPAFSKSVRRFYAPLYEYTRKYLTTVVFCNYCSAAARREVGFTGVPYKNQSDPDIQIHQLPCNRGESCKNDCNIENCHFLHTITYKKDLLRNGCAHEG